MASVRITLCGETGVGKSAICAQLLHNIFCEELDPTISDSYRTKLMVNNKEHIVDIHDLSTMDVDSEYYWAGNSRAYQYTEGIILVYSIANRQSFEELKKWKENISHLRKSAFGDRKYPFFIVGNKCDLEENRVVSPQEGEQIGAEFGYPFFETSAKTGMNVQDLFIEFTKRVLQPEWENVSKIVKKRQTKKSCQLM